MSRERNASRAPGSMVVSGRAVNVTASGDTSPSIGERGTGVHSAPGATYRQINGGIDRVTGDAEATSDVTSWEESKASAIHSLKCRPTQTQLRALQRAIVAASHDVQDWPQLPVALRRCGAATAPERRRAS